MAIVDVESDAVLAVLHAELLTPAFPADELITLDQLRASVSAGESSVIAVEDADGVPVAVAVGERSDTGVTLLAYLAVRAGVRSTGVGGRLLSHATDVWSARWRPLVIAAEIEHPAAHTGSADHGDPAARVRFYARHGVRALDLPYFQAALGPGHERVYGLMLTVVMLGDGGRGSAPDTVSTDVIRRFLVEYFTGTEGRVGDDSATSALFQALDRPEGIPLLGLDEPAAIPYSVPPVVPRPA